ncbi:MAG: PEP-utilizing enzyme [Actinomycetes bacterium]
MAAAVPTDHDTLSDPRVRTWLPDPSHYPEQLTPLSATVWLEAIGIGLHQALRELRGPFPGFVGRTHLGWAYEGELPLEWEPDPEAMRAAAAGIEHTWTTRIEPRVRAITAELHHLRPERGDAREAAAALQRMWELVVEQWVLHFHAVVPAQFAIEEFTDRYVARFGAGDPLAPYRLLQGSSNESLVADRQLLALAQEARDLGVADIVAAFPPETVTDRLRELHHGRMFLHSLDGYLLRYGGRSRWHELSVPRECERPEMTFQSMRLFLAGDHSPHGEPSRGRPPEGPAGEAHLVAEAPEIADVLAAARAAYALKESHVYHIDYPGLLATREVLLGFGRRLLAEGALRELDDMWLLTRGELLGLVTGESDVDIAVLLAARRAELQRGAVEGVRPHLGEAPDSAEQHAVLQKFYGSSGRAATSRSLQGSGAAPGVVDGVARLVKAPADFDRVRPGDVLVALTTTPAWTPLFPSLSGLVTETGGILCHAAIVAREYGIPAVVGASEATRVIPDGARVRVDGGTGRVEVL